MFLTVAAVPLLFLPVQLAPNDTLLFYLEKKEVSLTKAHNLALTSIIKTNFYIVEHLKMFI